VSDYTKNMKTLGWLESWRHNRNERKSRALEKEREYHKKLEENERMQDRLNPKCVCGHRKNLHGHGKTGGVGGCNVHLGPGPRPWCSCMVYISSAGYK